MTVRINKPALNLREELTKAQGVVRYEQRQFWFDIETLNTNPEFQDATGYALNSNWSISGGKLIGDGTSNGRVYQSISELEGNIGTEITVTVVVSSVTQGLVRVNCYGVQLPDITQAGTYTLTGNTVDSLNLYVNNGGVGSNFIGEIESIHVTYALGSDFVHSVPLGFKPVHVYEDGLLQREGENHDYTVVDTGFGYQIKPTVAPSATTETCVIAEREL